MGNREGLQTKSALHKTLMATMVIGVLLTLPVTAWTVIRQRLLSSMPNATMSISS